MLTDNISVPWLIAKLSKSESTDLESNQSPHFTRVLSFH
jgi:hypothetical protein